MRRYWIHKSGTDWYPQSFRPDCERTFTDGFGNDTSLFDMITRNSEYYLFNIFPTHIKLTANGNEYKQMKEWLNTNKHRALNFGAVK